MGIRRYKELSLPADRLILAVYSVYGGGAPFEWKSMVMFHLRVKS